MSRRNGLTEADIEILKELARCDMNTNEVARRTYRHRNTVLYHLEQIRAETGLNPRKFYDLVELMRIVDGRTDYD